ncbi:MAG: HEAT repeat domain-containing protein [Acidobacteriota bacterium]|nr:HEAT repeat domain-containing protein [Acidobacteriota bacterium]
MKTRHEVNAKHRADRSVVSRTEAVMSLAGEDNALLQRSILRYLSDRSPRVRSAALDVVREQKLLDADRSVLTLLADKSGIVRQAAAECLGVLYEGKAIEALWLYPLLKDPTAIVRVEAVESLAHIGDRAALSLIAGCLEDADPLVRAYAARSIAELQGQEFTAAIQRASQTETDENAKVGFADALLGLGDESQFSVLVGLLSSADYRVRTAAANALSVADLSVAQLRSALEAVSYAAQHALAVADRSTMERVEQELREQL